MDNPPPKGYGEGDAYPPGQQPPAYQPPQYPQGQGPPPAGPYPQAPPPGGQYPQAPPPAGPYPQAPPAGPYPQAPPAGPYPQQGYQPGYPPPVGPGGVNVQVQQPTQTTVVIQAGQTGFGPRPAQMTCPQCNAQIVTTTETSAGSFAWLIVLIVLLIAFVVFPFALLGCCFIPLCIPELRDVTHSCPNCKKTLGKFKRHF